MALLEVVSRIPLPPPQPRGRGRPVVYSDRLVLQSLLIMIVRRRETVSLLVAVLAAPTDEMARVWARLSLNGRLPHRRTLSLSWMGFAHVIRHASFRENLPDELLARFPLDQWQSPAARRHYRKLFMGELDKLLENFEWAEIELTRDVRLVALQLLDQYNVGRHDAIHLDNAALADVWDLASFNRAFRNVE